MLRKQKAAARFHNYQDEMNTIYNTNTTITANNIQRSTTRDFSVMKSIINSNSPIMHKHPINEERRYESKYIYLVFKIKNLNL